MNENNTAQKMFAKLQGKDVDEVKIDAIMAFNDVSDMIRKEALRLIRSGGIEKDDGTEYGPYMTCLYVAMENVTRKFKPEMKQYQKAAKNLKHF